ncbi:MULTISPECIES: nuclear transport factor 2 family protein [Pseudomonadota]|jgi:ketosteroid isomerase-like protein|uniref:YybH family protein n=1 Tax=Pseudomonadota TaxID=1224 RepID=UPI001ABF3E36|nr:MULTISPECIES: nuclear transport factor 2 family protein [Pseudomonadota]
MEIYTMQRNLVSRGALFAVCLSVSTAAIAQQPDREGAAAVLSSYKSAVEQLDITGVEKLFAPDAVVIESGKVEGNFDAYRDHHLGPELKEFKSFTFGDYKADIKMEGPVAIATETYTYRIVLKSGETVDRLGVATSVLKWNGQAWQIVTTHSSSRKPKTPAS